MTERDVRQAPPAVSADETEQQIRQTRAELALTLDALERKLTARHLVEKGFDMFETLNGNETLRRSLDVIRANPIPVALIGIGAAWLIANNTGVAERIAHDERVEAARQRVADTASEVSRRAGELATGMAEKVGLTDSGREQGDGWVHQVSDKAQGALRAARDSGGAILDRVGSYAGRTSRVADQIGGAFQRNPLIMGAIGVMAGALIAALLPPSRIENELLGETRDELLHKAEEAGEQAVQRVREAASEAAVRAVDAAAGAAVETVRNIGEKPAQA